MSADGQIEIAVKADGVDEAAADIGDQDAGGATSGRGGGGLSQRMGRAGIIGFIAGALLGPLLDVLDPILKILDAFLAPVAVMLLRLLQPVLRFLVSRVLPLWLDFMEFFQSDIASNWDILMAKVASFAPMLAPLAGLLGILNVDIEDLINIARSYRNMMIRELKSIPGRIWGFVKQIPDMIADRLRDTLPDLGGGLFGGGGGGDTGDSGGVVESVGDTVVDIGGGLVPFVDRVEKSGKVDLP